MESVLLRALSGARNGVATSLVSWEGQVYRFDPAASEERRLRRIREKQAGASADLAMDLAAISKPLSAGAIALDDVLASVAALKTLGPALAPTRKNNEADTLPPGINAPRNAREIIDRVVQDLSKITTAADLQKAARMAAPLGDLVDEVLADALMAWTYAVSIGDPDGPVLLTGNVMRRHDFGFGTRERGLHLRTAWAVPKQEIAARVPWRVNGSLLGLDVALSSLALRRIGGDRVIDVPTLSSNEREAFAVAASLLNPFALHDADRDLIADEVARGRQRVASLAEDGGALEAIAGEIRMDGWRRRALQWTMVHEPQQIVRMFSMTELLYLGGGPAAALDAWGMSAIASSGCVCTRLVPPNEYRTLLGRPQVGLMAATVADLNLHVAVLLRELRLPSALAKSVLVAAVQDFIDEVRPTDANDWLTLVRTAQAVPRERVEDYVAAAAADGPLIPETGTETR